MKTVYFIMGLYFFIGFAYDIENDRDFMTWIWLLTSQINFIGLMATIVIENNNKENK